MKILVVDDEKLLVKGITFNLEKRAPVHPATIEAYNDLLRCRRMKWEKGNSADAQDAHK